MRRSLVSLFNPFSRFPAPAPPASGASSHSSEHSPNQSDHSEDEMAPSTPRKSVRRSDQLLKKGQSHDESTASSTDSGDGQDPAPEKLVSPPSKKRESGGRRKWTQVRTVTSAEKGKPPIRNAYSQDEDYALIRHIISEQAGSELGGTSFWQRCQELKVTGVSRTYQSLKERFRRYIAPHIHRYAQLTADEKSQLLAEIKVRHRPKDSSPNKSPKRSNSDNRRTVPPDRVKETPKKQKQAKADVAGPSRAQPLLTRSASKPVSRNRLSRVQHAPIPKSKSKQPVANDSDESSVSRDDDADEETADQPHRRSPRQSAYLQKLREAEEQDDSKRSNFYTDDEDKTLIRYIVKHSRNADFRSLAGNSIWQELQRRKKLPGRTWSSMRERMLKQIIPNMHLYDLPIETVKQMLALSTLSESQKKRILSACTAKSD